MRRFGSVPAVFLAAAIIVAGRTGQATAAQDGNDASVAPQANGLTLPTMTVAVTSRGRTATYGTTPRMSVRRVR